MGVYPCCQQKVLRFDTTGQQVVSILSLNHGLVSFCVGILVMIIKLWGFKMSHNAKQTFVCGKQMLIFVNIKFLCVCVFCRAVVIAIIGCPETLLSLNPLPKIKKQINVKTKRMWFLLLIKVCMGLGIQTQYKLVKYLGVSEVVKVC